MKWEQIVVYDKEALPGKNLIKILQLIAEFIPVKYIAVDGVEGSGENVPLLKPKGDRHPLLFSMAELIKIADFVTQLDWGDFFLFANESDAMRISSQEPYAQAIAKTLTTVRAVDDAYFYIYTPNIELADALSLLPEGIERKSGNLEMLDYPG